MATQFEIDCALMAGAAYRSSRDKINRFPVPEGWAEVMLSYVTMPSGFEAVSFQRGNEIVISYAGTGPGLNQDWWANFGLYTGLGADQLREAALYYLQVKEANPNATISFTGHSLGGGIAALLGVFFDEKAVTFDPAPFGSSVSTGMRDDLISYLNGHGYDNGALNLLAPELLAFSNENLAARHANVSGMYVEGEILSDWFSSMIGVQTPLNHGPTDVSGSNLHAQSLLTAFVQNDQFRQVTYKLTDLLNMLFDSALYYNDPNKLIDPARNLLEHLIRHQEGLDPTVPNDGDAMLDRFTSDLWKIAQDGGLTMANNDLTKALAAFAMQAYYDNRPASNATLFDAETGGIHFDRMDVADTLAAAKGYTMYFTNYLATLPANDRDLIIAQLPDLLDWYIQAGSQAMTATAGTQRAFMLGGSGDDTLTGGNQADLLVGNGGMDNLNGGAGADLMIGGEGIDTYYLDGNDTILDTGRNFIVYQGQVIAGAFLREGTSNTYSFLGDNNFTLTFDSAAHLTVNGTDCITFEQQTSAADFANGDFGITLYDSVEGERTLTGTSGDDSTGALIFQNEGRYYFSGAISGSQPSFDLYPDWGEFTMIGTTPPNLTINGGDGNDQLIGLAGSDYITGGSGNDLILGEIEWISDDPAQYVLLNPWGDIGQGDISQGEAGKDVIGAGYGDDIVSGGDDNDFLEGGAGNDTVGGDSGNDVVTGSTGNDLLLGGEGNDLLYGDSALDLGWIGTADIAALNFKMTYAAKGYATSVTLENFTVIDAPESGDDMLYGGIGNDLLKGGGGNDTLLGEADHDNLIGGNGDDYLDGGDGNDWLVGDDATSASSGKDTLFGGAGDDRLEGNGGDDFLDGSAGADTLYGEDGNDTVFGGEGKDILAGGMGKDSLDGGISDDSLYGEEGDDTLYGGAGNDYLVGGVGNDIYVFGRGSGQDSLYETDGDADIIRFNDVLPGDLRVTRTQYDLSLAINGTGDSLTVAGWFNGNASRIEQVEFSDGTTWDAATLEGKIAAAPGTSGNDVLYGGTGNDTYVLSPGGGADIIQFDPDGYDTMAMGMGYDASALSLFKSGADMIVRLNDGTQFTFTGWFSASQYPIENFAFADGSRLTNAEFLAGSQMQSIGNAGNNTLLGYEGADTISGGAGWDYLYGYGGNDYLDGGTDCDHLYGGEGNDHLYGGAGWHGDILYGGEGGGADILDGGGGYDYLYGGDGDDVYMFGRGYDTSWVDDATQDADGWLWGGGEFASREGDVDTILFGEGITSADLQLTWDGSTWHGDYLLLAIDSAYNDMVYVVAHHGHDNSPVGIEQLKFANGETLLVADLLAQLMTGTSGNDGLYGTVSAGTHTMNGLDGDDRLEGYAGDETLIGGNGNDYLNGNGGNDLLYGGEGNDSLWGSGYLDGGDGDDDLKGRWGDDNASTFIGGNGDDFLYGGYGGDFLNGGPGNDLLDGGGGADVYLFNIGDGSDTIFNYDWDGCRMSEDTISFGSGIALVDLELFRSSFGGFVMKVGINGDQIAFQDQIGWFAFADGTVMSADELLSQENIHILPITGGDGNDYLYGSSNDDLIYGEAGDDTITGRAGADTLVGGDGDDTYRFNYGDGADIIDNYDTIGTDTATFDYGIALNDLELFKSNDDFIMKVGANGDQITFSNWFAGSAYQIDRFTFYDGTAVSTEELLAQKIIITSGDLNLVGTEGADIFTGGMGNDTIDGGAGNDTLAGGAGADVLTGGVGNDTYLYNPGDGVDEINDTALPDEGNVLVFGEGIIPDSLSLGLGSLLIRTGTDGDAIHIANFNPDDVYGEHAIETFQFADNATLSYAQLLAKGFDLTGAAGDDLVSGTNAVDRITGLDGNDTINGGADNDVLDGGVGNDTLAGGQGDDTLLGGAGDDRYLLQPGDGNDHVEDGQGNNTLVLGGSLTATDLEAERLGNDLVLRVSETQDSMRLADWFNQGQTDGVNSVAFADGTSLDRQGMEGLLNRPPVASADNLTVFEDGGPLHFAATALLDNDVDPNPGDLLSVVAIGASQIGVTVSLADGQISYDIGNGFQQLAAGEVTQDSFSYTVSDSKGAQASSPVNVDIVGINDAPVVAGDTASMVADVVLPSSGNVLANDFDIDNGTVLRVAEPGDYLGSYGTLSLATDGSYAYSLDNVSGMVQSLGREAVAADHFSYTATDGIASVASALDITISGSNDAPTLTAPLADRQVNFHKDFSWQLPAGSFADPDQGDTLDYSATLADGSPLPTWLAFDPATQTFSGRAPKQVGSVEVKVTATDKVAATGSTEGSLSASDLFRITVSHGNEGVGNGEDAPPAGHDGNCNDGPGTGPGAPGRRRDHDDYRSSEREGDRSDDLDDDGAWGQPQRVQPAYLNASHWDDRQSSATAKSGEQVDPSVVFGRWLTMDLAVSKALAEKKTLSWLDERLGADTTVLNKAGTGFLGSTTTFGTDLFSLQAGHGQELEGFKGLGEGLRKVA